MRFKEFCFMLYGLAPQILKIKHLNQPIHHFWKTSEQNHGFFDVSGNIFTKQENMSFVKLYPNISNLNFFAKYEKYNLISYEKHNDDDKKSLLLGNAAWEEFSWKNSTALEYMKEDEYRRIDFFGNVFYKDIGRNVTRYNSFSFVNRESFQKIHAMGDYTFSVNNFNLFYIHNLNYHGKIKILYSESLSPFYPIRKLEVKRFSNIYHCMFWNLKNEISVYIFVHLSDEFKLINRTNLEIPEKNIIDIVFDNGYIFVGLRDRIVIYNYSSVENKITKVTERKFLFPYYTELFLHDNFIYLNNQKYISYLKVDPNYYKTSKYPMLPSSSN